MKFQLHFFMFSLKNTEHSPRAIVETYEYVVCRSPRAFLRHYTASFSLLCYFVKIGLISLYNALFAHSIAVAIVYQPAGVNTHTRLPAEFVPSFGRGPVCWCGLRHWSAVISFILFLTIKFIFELFQHSLLFLN